MAELTASDRRAALVAGALSSEQLNWRPREDAWSVGQCLEHLRVTNEVYLPAIASSLEGKQPAMVEEITLGWLSRWFLRKFIVPDPKGARARAPKKIEPAGRVEPGVVERFLRSNEDVRRFVARAGAYDVNRIRFKNPFISALRFTAGAGLEIVAKHQDRHLLQAEGVRKSPGFPER